jgi:hypothetical protein
VLVGMGMPLQERFLHDNRLDLPSAYYATVGGAIDYVAGEARLAPRFLGGAGLEWLWRFTNDPRRLFSRYFVEPVALFKLVAQDHLRDRRRSDQTVGIFTASTRNPRTPPVDEDSGPRRPQLPAPSGDTHGEQYSLDMKTASHE